MNISHSSSKPSKSTEHQKDDSIGKSAASQLSSFLNETDHTQNSSVSSSSSPSPSSCHSGQKHINSMQYSIKLTHSSQQNDHNDSNETNPKLDNDKNLSSENNNIMTPMEEIELESNNALISEDFSNYNEVEKVPRKIRKRHSKKRLYFTNHIRLRRQRIRSCTIKNEIVKNENKKPVEVIVLDSDSEPSTNDTNTSNNIVNNKNKKLTRSHKRSKREKRRRKLLKLQQQLQQQQQPMFLLPNSTALTNTSVPHMTPSVPCVSNNPSDIQPFFLPAINPTTIQTPDGAKVTQFPFLFVSLGSNIAGNTPTTGFVYAQPNESFISTPPPPLQSELPDLTTVPTFEDDLIATDFLDVVLNEADDDEPLLVDSTLMNPVPAGHLEHKRSIEKNLERPKNKSIVTNNSVDRVENSRVDDNRRDEESQQQDLQEPPFVIMGRGEPVKGGVKYYVRYDIKLPNGKIKQEYKWMERVELLANHKEILFKAEEIFVGQNDSKTSNNSNEIDCNISKSETIKKSEPVSSSYPQASLQTSIIKTKRRKKVKKTRFQKRECHPVVDNTKKNTLRNSRKDDQAIEVSNASVSSMSNNQEASQDQTPMDIMNFLESKIRLRETLPLDMIVKYSEHLKNRNIPMNM